MILPSTIQVSSTKPIPEHFDTLFNIRDVYRLVRGTIRELSENMHLSELNNKIIKQRLGENNCIWSELDGEYVMSSEKTEVDDADLLTWYYHTPDGSIILNSNGRFELAGVKHAKKLAESVAIIAKAAYGSNSI